MGETTTATEGNVLQTSAVTKGDAVQTSIGTGGDALQTFTGQEGITSEQPQYTRRQVQKLISDALTEQARKHKAELSPIVKERDSFKSQLESNTSELTETNSEIEKLEAKIKDLAGSDPAKFDAIKELKAARDERKQLLGERKKLEAEKLLHSERIKKAEELERDVSILEIVEEYEEGDATKLSSICSIIQANSEEDIRKVADTLWPKKLLTPPLKPYSGMTEGGGQITEQDILKARYPSMFKK